MNPEASFPRDGPSTSSGCEDMHPRSTEAEAGGGTGMESGMQTAPAHLFSGKSASCTKELNPMPLSFVSSQQRPFPFPLFLSLALFGERRTNLCNGDFIIKQDKYK